MCVRGSYAVKPVLKWDTKVMMFGKEMTTSKITVYLYWHKNEKVGNTFKNNKNGHKLTLLGFTHNPLWLYSHTIRTIFLDQLYSTVT